MPAQAKRKITERYRARTLLFVSSRTRVSPLLLGASPSTALGAGGISPLSTGAGGGGGDPAFDGFSGTPVAISFPPSKTFVAGGTATASGDRAFIAASDLCLR